MENRKIYLSGGNSYILTLPKRWVEENGLKSGDYVTVEIHKDHLIIRSKRDKLKRIAEIDAKDESHDSLMRKIIAYYLAGYDTMRIKVYNEEHRRAISLTTDILMGAEIVEDLGREIVVEIFVDHRLSVERIAERMGRMCLTMISDFKQLVNSLDGYIYSSIIMRENELDRLHFLALRLLKLEAQKNLGELLEYRTVVRALERIGDHCAKMSESLMKVKIKISKLVELVDIIEGILKLTINAFLKKDTSMAEDVIREVEKFYGFEEKYSNTIFEALEDFWRKKESVEASANLRIILDSISRIAGYCSDIAESTINMCT